MNKSEMAVKLAKKLEMTQAKAAEIVDAIFHATKGIIAVELDAGRKVSMPGFGIFTTKKRGARQGRNPATGKTITIAARKYVVFKAGKTLKDKVAK
jgi:DNA-binding protein HU-beta